MPVAGLPALLGCQREHVPAPIQHVHRRQPHRGDAAACVCAGLICVSLEALRTMNKWSSPTPNRRSRANQMFSLQAMLDISVSEDKLQRSQNEGCARHIWSTDMHESTTCTCWGFKLILGNEPV